MHNGVILRNTMDTPTREELDRILKALEFARDVDPHEAFYRWPLPSSRLTGSDLRTIEVRFSIFAVPRLRRIASTRHHTGAIGDSTVTPGPVAR